MAIGRTFPEALQKVLRSLEQNRFGLNADTGEMHVRGLTDEELKRRIAEPTPNPTGPRRGARSPARSPNSLREVALQRFGAPRPGIRANGGRE